MDENIFSRNELYWGEDFQKYLSSLKVAVFGLGGVGGFALEALARAGIGNFLIVDFDTVSKTNINRQIIALHSTVGEKKTEVFKKRLSDINPNVKVTVYDGFFSDGVKEKVFSGEYSAEKGGVDFIADAIDTVKSKIGLIKFARIAGIEIISSLGAGNRMDGSKLYLADIMDVKTNDSFVKNVLHKLKKHAGIESGLKVIVSSEKAYSKRKIKTVETVDTGDGLSVEYTKFTPASTPVVPAIAGYLMADYILKTCYNRFFNKKA